MNHRIFSGLISPCLPQSRSASSRDPNEDDLLIFCHVVSPWIRLTALARPRHCSAAHRSSRLNGLKGCSLQNSPRLPFAHSNSRKNFSPCRNVSKSLMRCFSLCTCTQVFSSAASSSSYALWSPASIALSAKTGSLEDCNFQYSSGNTGVKLLTLDTGKLW